jgi:hypothetical protein
MWYFEHLNNSNSYIAIRNLKEMVGENTKIIIPYLEVEFLFKLLF